MSFAGDNEIAKLGDSAKESEATDSVIGLNYVRDFMK